MGSDDSERRFRVRPPNVFPRRLAPPLNSTQRITESFVIFTVPLSLSVFPVSTKALASAKTLGGFLYSAVNKAGKTVVEAGAKIKKTVEENSVEQQYEINERNIVRIACVNIKKNEQNGHSVGP
ncbi:hypothetical protein K0M31_017819 [Melipona bicolor]|uniref:Uncharacterized protein n=1 Tax=Melipona bicolor TaxID=60889 RepID=A0AA40G5L0_9HYME|nr:hypothetical protein K0M31_017819 [Melipona bicolor]